MVNKTILIILDGWGIRKSKNFNAVEKARTPNFEKFWHENPHTELYASEQYVGLPKGFIGNSEVGHMSLGAGRLMPQELMKINKSIKDKSFFKNKVLLSAMKKAHKKGVLHLMGLLSDGGVHSHINHLFALLDMAKKNKVPKVHIHCFLDGRDVPPQSALKYIRAVNAKCRKIKLGKISTIMGRFYAMDRDNRWNREHMAYSAIVDGKGKIASSAKKAVEQAYEHGETDEFVKPTIITNFKEAPSCVDKEDTIIFFNFREDRARELTKAFVEGKFKQFRRKQLLDLNFVTLTQYDSTIKAKVVFKPEVPKKIFPEIISEKGLKQFRIAETEKYAHVTYFFNGGNDKAFLGEDRKLIPSPHVQTYDKKPSMSAFTITSEVEKALAKRKYDFVLLNFANPDMVAHSGDLNAAIRAIEVVDVCLAKVVFAARKNGYQVVIVADHGNAEEMNGIHMTSHTLNKVPFIILSDKKYSISAGAKASIVQMGPTLLKLMDLKIPSIYDKPLVK